MTSRDNTFITLPTTKTKLKKASSFGAHPPKLDALPRDLKKLLTMLQHRRPANSGTEAQFIRRYIRPMGAAPDLYGNY